MRAHGLRHSLSVVMAIAKRLSKDCVLHTGGVYKNGYGYLIYKGKQVLAHRHAWEQKHGPIPVGMVMDHLCRNKLCVNVGHLEPVAQGENVMRGLATSAVNARKISCLNGHPLSGDNLYMAQNGRNCLACRRDNMRAWRERDRQKAASGFWG